MDMEEIVRRLHDAGCRIERSQLNAKGRFVHLIQPWDVAMFQEDIGDILLGRATLREVMGRNEGADLANPWPVSSHRAMPRLNRS